MSKWLKALGLAAVVTVAAVMVPLYGDPGTSSVAHLRENLAAVQLNLPDDAVKELDAVASIAGQSDGVSVSPAA